jgi:hypothetical protein
MVLEKYVIKGSMEEIETKLEDLAESIEGTVEHMTFELYTNDIPSYIKPFFKFEEICRDIKVDLEKKFEEEGIRMGVEACVGEWSNSRARFLIEVGKPPKLTPPPIPPILGLSPAGAGAIGVVVRLLPRIFSIVISVILAILALVVVNFMIQLVHGIVTITVNVTKAIKEIPKEIKEAGISWAPLIVLGVLIFLALKGERRG